MKKFVSILFLAIIVGAAANAQHSKLKWETDMMTAVNDAVKSDRPVLLFFTGSDWCGWCKRLQREVFFTPEFEKWADENVVLMELDFPRRTPISQELREQNGQLQQMFGVRGYPTIWFVNPTVNSETNQVNFARIGKTGYVAGGPSAWIGTADKILAQQQ